MSGLLLVLLRELEDVHRLRGLLWYNTRSCVRYGHRIHRASAHSGGYLASSAPAPAGAVREVSAGMLEQRRRSIAAMP
eukprot:1009869-Rhodomonas_salina.1